MENKGDTEAFHCHTASGRMFFFRRRTPMGREPLSQPPPPDLDETSNAAKGKAERKDGQEWLAYRDDAADDSEDDVAPSDENEDADADADADADELTRTALGDQVEEGAPSAHLVEGDDASEDVVEDDDEKNDAWTRKIQAGQSGKAAPLTSLLEGNAGSEEVKEDDNGVGSKTIQQDHGEEAASLAGVLERNGGADDVVEEAGDDDRTRKVPQTLGGAATLAHNEMSFVSTNIKGGDLPRFIAVNRRPEGWSDHDNYRDGKNEGTAGMENTTSANKRRTRKADVSRPIGSARRRPGRKRKSTAAHSKRSNQKEKYKQDEILSQENAATEKQQQKKQQPQPLTKQSVEGLPLEVLEYWKDSDEEDDCTLLPLEVVAYWEDSDAEDKCTLPVSRPLSDWKTRAWHRLSQQTEEGTTGTLTVSPSPSHWKVRAWRRLCHQVPLPSAPKFMEERFRPRTLGVTLTTKRLSLRSPHSPPPSSSISSSARRASSSKTLPIQRRKSQGSSAKRRSTIGESALLMKRVPYTKEETQGTPLFDYLIRRDLPDLRFKSQVPIPCCSLPFL
jgi:hypothetical protein